MSHSSPNKRQCCSRVGNRQKAKAMEKEEEEDAAAGGGGADGASADQKMSYVLLRAAAGPDPGVGAAATASLARLASEAPLTVAQMWLEQFARVDSGAGSPAEYSAPKRVLLLSALQAISGGVISNAYNAEQCESNFNCAKNIFEFEREIAVCS